MDNQLKQAAETAIRLMDLTTLRVDDTVESVAGLTHRGVTSHGNVAALCVYPRFVPLVLSVLREIGAKAGSIRVATVSQFPHGNADLASAVASTREGIEAGAHEIDTVIPWRALREGRRGICLRQLQAVRELCGDEIRMKVILESGELHEEELIREASEVALEAGADFLKTSTGKVPVNATPAAARIMLEAIRDSGRVCGLKIAGGVKTVEDARDYLELAREFFGEAYLQPATFRFGASGLLDVLLKLLDEGEMTSNTSY